MLSNFNSETRFGIPSSWRIFLTHKLRKIDNLFFWTTYSIFKTSTILRGSLPLTDRAKISYIVFWYRKATFETRSSRKVIFTPPYSAYLAQGNSLSETIKYS